MNWTTTLSLIASAIRYINPFKNKFYLNIELTSDNVIMPRRAHDSDAGIDVFSPIDVTIPPRGDVLIPLDFKTQFPEGWALIFKEKSGQATKKKLDIGACVVDSGYEGVVHSHLFNNSDYTVNIEKGEKIAQFIVVPVWTGQPKSVKNIKKQSKRGSGGFGSTGIK